MTTEARFRIFVWEGDGISAAYHDDGTLVVLAETADEARSLMRDERTKMTADLSAWYGERDALAASMGYLAGGVIRKGFWQTPEGSALWSRMPSGSSWDGGDSALDREPRVVEIDGPKWVAFNGGGYD